MTLQSIIYIKFLINTIVGHNFYFKFSTLNNVSRKNKNKIQWILRFTQNLEKYILVSIYYYKARRTLNTTNRIILWSQRYFPWIVSAGIIITVIICVYKYEPLQSTTNIAAHSRSNKYRIRKTFRQVHYEHDYSFA